MIGNGRLMDPGGSTVQRGTQPQTAPGTSRSPPPLSTAAELPAPPLIWQVRRILRVKASLGVEINSKRNTMGIRHGEDHFIEAHRFAMFDWRWALRGWSGWLPSEWAFRFKRLAEDSGRPYSA